MENERVGAEIVVNSRTETAEQTRAATEVNDFVKGVVQHPARELPW